MIEKGVVKRLERALLIEIGRLVEPYGFQAKPRDQSFYREIPLGRWALHLSFVENGELEAALDVAIRFDEVEDLVNSVSRLLTESQKRDTWTLGCELGNLTAGRPRRWKVSRNNLEQAAGEMAAFFAEVGIPYLEKHSTPQRTLDALGGNSRAASIHSPFHVARAKRAIALAFWLRDKARFEELTCEMDRFLTERNERGRDSYDALTKSLASKWS